MEELKEELKLANKKIEKLELELETLKKKNARNAGRKGLSQEQKEEILDLKKRGFSIRDSAYLMKMSVGTIHRILKEMETNEHK